jgi:ABC-type dipeptide/oligopeptide/nickel transport system permease component
MLRYVQLRLLTAIPTIVGLSILVFLMVHLLPGDAVDVMLTQQGATAEQLKQLKAQLGLDDPLWEQYGRFARDALHGDLGRSLFSHQPVIDQILEQFPATIQLTLAGMALALVFGIPLGMLAAVKQNSWLDSVSMAISLVGVAMPSFWLGLLLIYLFGMKLPLFPVAGTLGWKSLVLPAITLGFHSTGIIARLTRSSMLEVLRNEYVTTARAKGLGERAVLVRHTLRNAILPVVTVIGLQFGYLLGGAVIIETVFARQGVGRLVVQAIQQRDGPLVQGTVLFLAVIFVSANLVVDLSYAALDPRIRFQ